MRKNNIMKFLQEINGGQSSTRLMFVIGMSWSMIMSSVMTFAFRWSPGEFIAVFTATSGIFVGLKLGQKPMEVRPPEKKEDKSVNDE